MCALGAASVIVPHACEDSLIEEDALAHLHAVSPLSSQRSEMFVSVWYNTVHVSIHKDQMVPPWELMRDT